MRKTSSEYSKRQQKNQRERSKLPFDLSKETPAGVWIPTTAGAFSSRVRTRAELREIIGQYCLICDTFLTSPARCDIFEQAKDGMYSLRISFHLETKDKSPFASKLEIPKITDDDIPF
jgi:hypothetical protein